MPSGLTTFNPYALNAAAVYPNIMIASSPEAYGTVRKLKEDFFVKVINIGLF